MLKLFKRFILTLIILSLIVATTLKAESQLKKYASDTNIISLLKQVIYF